MEQPESRIIVYNFGDYELHYNTNCRKYYIHGMNGGLFCLDCGCEVPKTVVIGHLEKEEK